MPKGKVVWKPLKKGTYKAKPKKAKVLTPSQKKRLAKTTTKKV